MVRAGAMLASFGFDEPVDEQGDGADGDEGGGSPVRFEEHGPHGEWAFEEVVGAFGEGLVFVEGEEPVGGALAGFMLVTSA